MATAKDGGGFPEPYADVVERDGCNIEVTRCGGIRCHVHLYDQCPSLRASMSVGPIHPTGLADKLSDAWHGGNRVATVFNAYTSLLWLPLLFFLVAHFIGLSSTQKLWAGIVGIYMAWGPFKAVRYARRHGWPEPEDQAGGGT